MSTAYEAYGRRRQKERTRQALIEAARALVADGRAPGVDEVAEHAGVSRTTAYRYFPNRRLLLAAAHPEVAARSLLPQAAPDDALARLDLAVRAFTELILDTEAQQRTMLRLSLEESPAGPDSLPLRQGRAIGWFTEALEPLREQLGGEQLHRLVLAIRSATGIEALVWLVDIGRLDRREAAELMQWVARTMVQAALDANPPPGPSSDS